MKALTFIHLFAAIAANLNFYIQSERPKSHTNTTDLPDRPRY
jgi:hypothetical protein